MRQRVILIVDDDPSVRETFGLMLGNRCRVLTASSAEQGLGLLDKNEVDVVFLDLGLPGMGGLDALPIIRERNSDVDVVITTVEKDVRTVVRAMQLGAIDYITKDLHPDELVGRLNKILESRQKERQVRYLEAEVSRHDADELIPGTSGAMREVYSMAEQVAPLTSTVLITGESGTGKEVLAKAIHRMGTRSKAPFVVVNLPAIPDGLMESDLFGHEKGAFTGASSARHGKFELADGGTIFLDEVGDLSFSLQGKLLRAIREGEIERVGGNRVLHVDARIIAATRTDLETAVKEGRFREDLYYRLNVVRIRMPALRQRPEDIDALARAFVPRLGRKLGKRIEGIEPEAIEALKAYPWPGNVGELVNMIERIVALKRDEGVITPKDLPAEFRAQMTDLQESARLEGADFATVCEAFERSYIMKTMERCRWSRKATAEALRMPLSTLKYKLGRLGICDLPHEGEAESERKDPKRN